MNFFKSAILFLSCVFGINAAAQTSSFSSSNIDSLLTEYIKHAENGLAKAYCLDQIVRYYSNYEEYENAKKYSEASGNLSTQLENEDVTFRYRYRNAKLDYMQSGENLLDTTAYVEAYAYFKANDPKFCIDISTVMAFYLDGMSGNGSGYDKKAYPERIIAWYMLAGDDNLEREQYTLAAATYCNASLSLKKLGELDQAEKAAKKALNANNLSEAKRWAGNIYSALQDIYNWQQDTLKLNALEQELMLADRKLLLAFYETEMFETEMGSYEDPNALNDRSDKWTKKYDLLLAELDPEKAAKEEEWRRAAIERAKQDEEREKEKKIALQLEREAQAIEDAKSREEWEEKRQERLAEMKRHAQETWDETLRNGSLCDCLKDAAATMEEYRKMNYELGEEEGNVDRVFSYPCVEYRKPRILIEDDHEKEKHLNELKKCAEFEQVNEEMALYRAWTSARREEMAEDMMAESVDAVEELRSNPYDGLKNEIKAQKTANRENYTTVNFEEQDYITTTIGEQEWMAENLNVTKFRNGDPIPEAKTISDWVKASENGQPTWSYYDFDPTNAETYGKLYNWFAVIDLRGLEPEGWYIPENTDWETLFQTLGGNEIAGQKMKNVAGWNPLEEATSDNSSWFAGIPRGYYSDGSNGSKQFSFMHETGFWWSATVDFGQFRAYYVTLNDYENSVRLSENYRGVGASVRCIKGDKFAKVKVKIEHPNMTCKNVIDTKTYKSTKIGKATWMAENLNTSVFQNGDSIPQANTLWEWEKAKEDETPAWCYYEFEDKNGIKYGKLYNWYAIIDIRKLVPTGWHIPKNNEVDKMIEHLGGEDVAAEKLRSTEGWDGKNGTNSSGFNALPSGARKSDEFYGSNYRHKAIWWSISVWDGQFFQASFSIDGNSVWLDDSDDNESRGYAVRCVKD
ncbi:MAG: hypothetical protein GQ574_11940 [Crocinitomix sp.]|nr:hypothetical protein [Crocinitomix sp.]